MFYDFSFQIEANTAKSDLHTQDVHLTHGIIHRVEIGFPAGCRGYAHVAIRHGLHQLWPTNPAGSFNADNYTIVINEYYPLHTAPYRLTLHGWSPGTAYPHTIEIRFGILPVEVLAPEETFIQAFKKLLKRLRL